MVSILAVLRGVFTTIAMMCLPEEAPVWKFFHLCLGHTTQKQLNTDTEAKYH